MGKQLRDLADPLRGQSFQDVLDVLVRVKPIELGRLDQAGDGCRSLARRQRSTARIRRLDRLPSPGSAASSLCTGAFGATAHANRTPGLDLISVALDSLQLSIEDLPGRARVSRQKPTTMLPWQVATSAEKPGQSQRQCSPRMTTRANGWPR